MAQIWDDGYSRRDAEREPRGRRGRRGGGPRGDWNEWGGERRPLHHRHDHFEDHAYAYDDRSPRSDRWRGRFGRDELGEATRRLVGALRALARTQESGQRKAIAIMDDTTRTIYRLLSEEPGTVAATPEAGPSATASPGDGSVD